MYWHISLQERESIEFHLNKWLRYWDIATILRRNPWTISREIERNSVKKRWKRKREYLAVEAHIKAYLRRYTCKTQSMKINFNSELRWFIIEQFSRTDIIPSPKVIASLWNSSCSDPKKHISHTSIYSWLETGMGEKYKQKLMFKYKGYKKKKEVADSVGKILWRIGIEQRPEIINDRSEAWHFEADLIVSKQWFKWALLTLIDRQTRLPRVFKIKNKKSSHIMKLIAGLKDEVGMKSVTFDNGMEFAKHYLLNDIWIDTYFCNPYSSWEKWSIENLNRIIRRFFPKGTIFDHVSKEKIKSICDIIANTPREILWFISPNQAHFSKTV